MEAVGYLKELRHQKGREILVLRLKEEIQALESTILNDEDGNCLHEKIRRKVLLEIINKPGQIIEELESVWQEEE